MRIVKFALIVLVVLIIMFTSFFCHELSHVVFFDYAGIDSNIEFDLYRGWLPSLKTTPINFGDDSISETDYDRMELLHGMSDVVKYNLVTVELFLALIIFLLIIVAYDDKNK